MIDDKFKSKNVISIFLGKTSYKEAIDIKKIKKTDMIKKQKQENLS